METQPPAAIVRMPYNYKEKSHRSRTRYGYHVFQSRYLDDFRNLPDMDQQELIRGRDWRLRAEGNFLDLTMSDDEDSIDSTDTPPGKTPVKGSELGRVVGIHWRNLPRDVQIAWNTRAGNLNKLLLPGKFLRAPRCFSVGNMNFEEYALFSMSNEWFDVCKIIHHTLWTKPRSRLCAKAYTFGKERVQLYSQTYRVFVMTDLLRFALLKRVRNVFRNSEKVYETTLVTVVHMHSKDRMHEVFTLNKLCSTIVEKNGRIHSCAGKVILRKDGKDIVGYIISEKGNTWTVHLVTNDKISVTRVKLNNALSGYIYPGG